MQKKSKIIIASIVSAILLIVGVFSVVALTGSSGDNSQTAVSEKLSLGQKFLLDLEYDKAVAEFNAVIEIEPKNADAYIGLADAYIGLGEEDKAIETLEKGFSETGDETIKAKLEELKVPAETTTAEVTTTVPETTTTEETTTTPEVTIVAETTTTASEKPEIRYFDDCCYAIYKYDSDGRVIYEEIYSNNGEIPHSKYWILYDSDGNFIGEKLYLIPRGGYNFLEYDSQNKLIKSTYYVDNSVLAYADYEYNANGKLAKEISYELNYETKKFELSSIYEYDSSEKLIKRTLYNSDGTYDVAEEGKTIYYNADGTVDWVSSYGLDSGTGGVWLGCPNDRDHHKPRAQYD